MTMKLYKNGIVNLAIILLIVFLSGCAQTAQIKNLALPPVTTIEGSASEFTSNSFLLQDRSGTIKIRATLSEDIQLKLSKNKQIKVYGNLLAGNKKIFDGYVIELMSGEQIIISNPGGHFGFIIQSSFQE